MEKVLRDEFIRSFMTSDSGYRQMERPLTAFGIRIIRLGDTGEPYDTVAEVDDNLVAAIFETLEKLDAGGRVARLSWRSLIGVICGDYAALSACFACTTQEQGVLGAARILIAVMTLPLNTKVCPQALSQLELATHKCEPVGTADAILKLPSSKD